MRPHTTAIFLAITAFLVLPAGALAGGWATVGLSSTPDGLSAGAEWPVELEILQHGRTPLDDVHPAVTITAGDETHTFPARHTGRHGIYRASVKFPHGGRWEYVVDDGFTAHHPYPAVVVGGPARSSVAAGRASDGSGPAFDRIGLAALAGLAAAGAALRLPGRRRRAARAAVEA